MSKALFTNVDCVSFYVDDLDKGLKFYQDAMGLKLLWRADKSCGLGMEDDITEVVLVNEHNPMVDFKVDSVVDAIPEIVKAGGKVVYGPFDIDIGKCAVITDLWENTYCILDMTKGKYTVDESGKVTGVK